MRYLTSYRFFVLAKVGFSIAYLWICWDFLRINRAVWGDLHDLLPDLAGESIVSDSTINQALVQVLLFLSAPAAIWIFVLLAPIAVALFVWGKFRWLQLGVGLWLWLSIIGLTARASLLMSTADFWLAWSFILYAAAAVITPTRRWEKSQPPLRRDLWRENPVVASEYALLLAVLQFTVYFYAGVNKLIDGWTPWIYGTAIQNLSYDLSMRDYALGLPVPYAISLVLCYVTLLQRLVVPFGFFIMRYRGWAVLILAAMHVGYEALMQVAIFPLVGISGLLMIVPPRQLALPLFSRPSLRKDKRERKFEKSIAGPVPHLVSNLAVLVIIAVLLIGPVFNIFESPEIPYWKVKVGTLLHWTMFSDGGKMARVRLHVGVLVRDPQTGVQRYDEVADLPLRYLPDTWRTRFYQQTLLYKAAAHRHDTGEQLSQSDYLPAYLHAAEKLYSSQTPQSPPIEHVSLKLAPYGHSPFQNADDSDH